MEEFIIWIIICVVVLIIPIVWAQWVTKNFFLKLVQVVASRGGKVLCEVIHPIQNYYVVGEHRDGYLIIKDNTSNGKDKNKVKRLAMENDYIFRSWGVNCVRYTEIDNILVKPNLTGVTGFDAIKQENLYIRALTDPQNNKEKQLQTIIIIIGIIILLGIFYLIYNNGILLDKLSLIAKNVKPMVSTIN